ncbi:MAG TPA: autotransporter domain-containing protein [Verrucomicrobiae bacterium]|nr:autotransporter domain-containing protein [Verrucomicrobiae bacterium]
MILAGQGDSAWAATDNWTASSAGSWFTAGNWSVGVPSPADDAIITNTSAIVEGATGATANSLTVQGGNVTVGSISGGSLTVGGEIAVGTLGTSASLTFNLGTISVNTLSIGANGSYSDTSSGTIILSGSSPTINVAGGVTVVMNSQVTGTSGLIKGSLGTLTLAGNNTYSGGTTISLGTLQVGNGGTSGSLGDGDVVDNASLIFSRSDSDVVTNSISGTGSLTQAGSGTLILIGTNSYTGRTIINAGTLQVGNGGTIGTLGSGDVTNNSALAFNRSDSLAVSNNISGGGNLIQAGSGTLVLVGSNTYAGSTTISTGTLQVGDGGTNGTLGTGNVINKSALVFDHSDSVVVSNSISGGGSLTQAGSGTLILAVSNTYTGKTIISSGTLQVGLGGTSGSLGSGTVSNDSALVFNLSNTILVTNFISGIGSLTQAGTGTLILSNVNTYSGGTWISNGGTLAVRNGNALGSGDLNLIDGTLKLTTGIVVNVGGNYTQGTNGSLEVDIGGTNRFGQLNIAGAASLDGTVHVAQVGGYVPQHNDQFTLLIASNGVSGTFSTVTNDIVHSLLLNPNLIYGTNDVILQWAQASFVPFALTRNQKAVAHALDLAAPSTSTSTVALIDFLDNVSDVTNDLPAAFNLIAPEELTAMYTAAFAGMEAQGSRFLKRANELRAGYRNLYINAYNDYATGGGGAGTPPADPTTTGSSSDIFARTLDNPWSIYMDGGGKFVDVGGDTNAAGYNLSSGDFSVGLDRWLNKQLVVGGGLSYDSSSVGLTGTGHIDMKSYLGAIYAAWFAEGLHIEGQAGGGLNSYNTRRQGLQGLANGSTDGLEWNGLLGGGYDWQNGPWSYGPQLVVQYMSASIDPFTEKGSLAPLHVESQTADSLHTQLGADLRYRSYVRPTLTFITPELSLAWQHNYLADSYPLRSRLANGDGGVFTVHGPAIGSDSVLISLGITVQWKPSLSTYLHYTLQAGTSGYQANSVDAGLQLNF